MPFSIRLVESASASDRINAARAFIESHPPDREILIVGASRDAADELARLVATRWGATFGLHRYSLVQLAARLALTHMAGQGTAPATPLGSEAIAARVSFQALDDGALNYYTPVVPFPGFPRALARTLAELRLAGIAPHTVEAAAHGDVTNLLRRFDEQLASGHVHDLAGLLEAAAEAAAADPPPAFLTMPLVLLDVAVNSPAHQTFVAALLTQAPSVLVTLPTGDEETRRAFQALAPGSGAAATWPQSPTPGPTPAPVHDELDRLRTFIFSPEAPPEDARTGKVVLFSAPGEGRESVEIARLALEEARNGVPFDRMAVLLRVPGVYTPLLETALTRAGIPAYFAQGTMRPDPAGRAFLTLLDCAVDRFSARRFAEYLAFGQVAAAGANDQPQTGGPEWTPPEDESLGPAAAQSQPDAPTQTGDGDAGTPVPDDQPVLSGDDVPVLHGGLRAPWKWEELLVESTVIGGLDRWSRRLDGLAAEFRLRLRDLTRESPDSPHVQAIERDLRDLDHLRGFALPVIERLAALPVAATWGEWIPALEALAPLVLRKPKRVLTVLAAAAGAGWACQARRSAVEDRGLPVGVEAPHAPDMAVEVACGDEICQHRLIEGGRAPVQQCPRRAKRVNEGGRCDEVPKPDRRKQDLAERAEVDHPLGAVESLHRGQRLPRVPVLAAVIVLDDPRRRAGRPLEESEPAAQAHRRPKRELMRRGDVHQPRSRFGRGNGIQRETLPVDGNGGHGCARAEERHACAPVPGIFHPHDITGIRQQVCDQIQRLLRSRHDDDLIGVAPHHAGIP